MEVAGVESRFDALGRWRATAFLIAGAFLVAFVVRNVIIAWGGGFSETTEAALYVATVAPTELAAYAGLLGLYPEMSERTPRAAGAGVIFASIAAIAVVGFGVGSVPPLLASGSPEPPGIVRLLWIVMLITTILGFLTFGIASLRSRVPSRTVGALLLVPPITYIVMMAGGILGYTPPWSTVALSAVQAVAHLAIGLTLRSGGVSSERTQQAPDSAA